MLWCRDREAWRVIGLRYVPWLAAFSLAWEVAHVPLYTLWREAALDYIAFAVVHCTAGDLLIGSSALFLLLILGREGCVADWRWLRIAALTVAFGTGYTVFSEWINTEIRGSWAYASAMPTVDIGEFEVGLTPLAQWIVVPVLALHLARKEG